MKSRKFIYSFLLICFLLLPTAIFASGGEEGGHAAFALTFLFLAIIIVLAKVSWLVERIGQPPVLGELIMGIIIGNIGLLGWHFFDQIKHDSFIAFLSELGVVVLLFQIGLESNIREMKKVGFKSLFVAIIGVILPFVLGTYLIGPWLLPGLSFNAYLFLGATLTATSVGITARVFKDLKKLQIAEAQIVLGAAVIDDVLGLLILAVVSAIVSVGTVSLATIGIISLKAVSFLVLAIVIGQLIAPILGKFFSKVHSGVGMKFSLAFAFGLVFAYLAALVGLAPIVGAFAAGLILDPVHFKWFKSQSFIKGLQKLKDKMQVEEVKKDLDEMIHKHQHGHIEDLFENVSHFLVPVFFVYTGMQVNLQTFLDPAVILSALGITVAAVIGKLVAGWGAGKGVNKTLIGFGMVPRGEVGLIFAAVGKQLGVVNDSIYSVVVIMVILTTLLTPPILTYLLKKNNKQEPEAVQA